MGSNEVLTLLVHVINFLDKWHLCFFSQMEKGHLLLIKEPSARASHSAGHGRRFPFLGLSVLSPMCFIKEPEGS